jgi:hypothetical protein
MWPAWQEPKGSVKFTRVTVGEQGLPSADGADAEQAASLRQNLADELDQTRMKLARSRSHLRECVEGRRHIGLRGMARARFDVRQLEAAHNELDRMITALDRRFGAASPQAR